MNAVRRTPREFHHKGAGNPDSKPAWTPTLKLPNKSAAYAPDKGQRPFLQNPLFPKQRHFPEK